ncbi:MAG TPA: GNAT family N-acetyltransferase [Noviherbaspirillum sp.]|nr:GNAT family N-acetyltransferase [Noviherbaspirillum sp.]
MSIKVTLGDWETQREGAQAVRYQVFVVEQKVPLEMEWDEMDARCVHALVLDDEARPVATGRLLPDGHIGRMAVLPRARGNGVGAAVLQALMKAAKARGDTRVMLNAQTHAEPFYARFGFVRDGEEFEEAGIPHIAMQCRI